ncbi:NAD(P)/FAD-dependent oxidoreductase [Amycolatopsis sp. cg5]|uniref:NAD(P)/FAD-dependent oxidoreductase n=1 Tax=Amycolatopsis sp. cg5 TaxID=3238802 RepID=UPI0035244090
MSGFEEYDAIVVGAGAIGLSAAKALTRRKMRTLVLEAGQLFHEHGSSGGTVRHFRLQYSQEDLSVLAMQGLREWSHLEVESGRRLLHPVGSLWFGDTEAETNEGQISSTARVMDNLGIPYEWLRARDLQNRFGFTDLPRHYEGFLQPDGAIVDVKATLFALYGLSVRAGARVVPGSRVHSLTPARGKIRVEAASGNYLAETVVLAAGAGTNSLLSPLGAAMDYRVFEMANIQFAPAGRAPALPFWSAFQQPTSADASLFHGFGPLPWARTNECRIAPDFEIDELEPSATPALVPRAKDVSRAENWVRRHMPMLRPEPLHASTCQAVLPRDLDRQFYLSLVDSPALDGARLAVFAAGWGFKFVPTFGQVLADWAGTGSTDVAVARLSMAPAVS